MATVLFLAWESPWPPYGGGSLRTWGLLRQIARNHTVDLLVLTRKPLSADQERALSPYARRIVRAPMRDGGWRNRLQILARMAGGLLPYHSALVPHSLKGEAEAIALLQADHDIIFTAIGHWGVLAAQYPSPQWVLNQMDADIQCWQAYAAQAGNPLVKGAAWINYALARHHFPGVYAQVDEIICVSEQDQALTRAVAGDTPVDVIYNGIEGAYYQPQHTVRDPSAAGLQILFTGTSARRNVTALHDFAGNVLPLVRAQIPDAHLLVAGDFSAKAQAAFRHVQGISFTGRVPDIRPYFDQSDIFISPFRDAHGSKLKVAEAMAMALPVVSTPAGVRGFPVTHGDSVLVAESDADFARTIVMLARDADLRARIGARARAVALAQLDWDLLGVELETILERVLATAAPIAVPTAP